MIKSLLREYAAAAHEEELRRALRAVAEAFKRWEGGELGSGELSEIIHKFHQAGFGAGAVRALQRDPCGDAGGLRDRGGVLDRRAIPAELLEHLAGAIEFYESEMAPS